MPNAARARARATPGRGNLPDEIIVWEILARLPPKSLLCCCSVCRAWRRVTSARDFLLAHHGCQPSLPLFSSNGGVHHRNKLGVYYYNILAFDHRATTNDDQLNIVAQLDEDFYLKASCNGLLVLSKWDMIFGSALFSLCNPATREHARLWLPVEYDILGMYAHHPTGECQLLLQLRTCKIADWGHGHQIGCYVFTFGFDQLRYIGRPGIAMGIFSVPVRMRESLHWYPVHYPSGTSPSMYDSKVVVFDTIAESFRQMRAPVAPGGSCIFDMDGTLGIHSRDYAMENIDIWVLQNYESEVWDLKFRIKLPVADIRRKTENSSDRCCFGGWWRSLAGQG